MSVISPTRCVVCGPVSADVVFQGQDRLHGTAGRFHYARCPSCGLVFLAEPLSQADLDTHYPDAYDPHGPGPLRADGITAGRKKTIGALSAWIRARFIDRLKGISVHGAAFRRLDGTHRVLDVGCGAGRFLYDLRIAKGVQVAGVEISKRAVARAKSDHGLDIFHGELRAAPYLPESFDLITSWWALEHMIDPQVNLELMANMLKDSGTLLLGVPNADSVNARLFKSRWYHLDCPRHLHLWNPFAIRKLLRRCGLTVTRIVFDKTPWGLLGSLQYAFYGNNYTPETKNRIARNPLLYLAALPWSIGVGGLGFSDIMVVHCKKSSRTSQLPKQ